jgi:hypothetical protein
MDSDTHLAILNRPKKMQRGMTNRHRLRGAQFSGEGDGTHCRKGGEHGRLSRHPHHCRAL